MKVAFFGYAWNPAFEVDAYMGETITSLLEAGVDVDLYLGGQISREYGIYGFNPAVPVDRVAEFIAAERYDGAIAFNNAMLAPQIRSALTGRVATVIVDEPEHLFDHTGEGCMAAFAGEVQIVAMSSALEQRIRREVKDCASRLHFMLPATNPGARDPTAAPRHPISWIASFLGDANLDTYLGFILGDPDYHALTRRCLDLLATEGGLQRLRAQTGRDRELIESLRWPVDYFIAQMQNILTNRDRVEVVERLAPQGLALFGNPGWRKLLTYNAAVLAALQPGTPPSRHRELQAIYDTSKIAINVPQRHIARGAVQYRVLDVMGSNALMITRRDAPSDLARVFGADSPLPTYGDFDELEALCARYLKDEPERRRLVAQCNALVADGFSFADRARTLLAIIGLEPRAGAPPGHRRWVDLRLFSEN